MTSNFDLCKKEFKKLTTAMKNTYPKIKTLFCEKHILDYLTFDNKMMNPTRRNFLSEKKYWVLLVLLEKFNIKSFIKWLQNCKE